MNVGDYGDRPRHAREAIGIESRSIKNIRDDRRGAVTFIQLPNGDAETITAEDLK